VLTHCLALFFGVGRALCVLALGLVEVVAAQALDVVYQAQKTRLLRIVERRGG
jgi:hypothetical protein